MEPQDLLELFLHQLNHGIGTRDFAGMIALLHPAAELRFVGLPVGPFECAASIAKFLSDHPPPSELVLSMKPTEESATALAVYAWADTPRDPGGLLRVTVKEHLIGELEFVVRHPYHDWPAFG